jgi:hypothetical protein
MHGEHAHLSSGMILRGGFNLDVDFVCQRGILELREATPLGVVEVS